jgi:hypothetical protein
MPARGPYSIGVFAGKASWTAARGGRGREALIGAKGNAIALAALALLLGARAASADAGPETDNTLATLCGILESSAKTEGLPVDFFTKLIWRESAFRPTAVSPAGAQGVAQFMPQTASERGLVDPFDPASAIPASAKYLGELKRRFGNLGLAAAAYNAGETAVANWLADKGSLPFETQDYVLAITGHAADEWRAAKPADAAKPPVSASPTPAPPASAPPASAPPTAATSAPVPPASAPLASASPAAKPPADAKPEPVPSCLSLIASLRTTTTASPVVSGWFAPWGVQIAASFSRGSAMRAYARVQHDFYSVIGPKSPFVLGSVVRSRGFRPFYRVRIGAQNRREADKICASLEAAGGACVVLRS